MASVKTAVSQQSFLLIFGPSGSGKSSVLHAGLLPELKKDGDWIFVKMRPGAKPLTALINSFMDAAYPENSLRSRQVEAANFMESAHDSTDEWVANLQQLWNQRLRHKRFLLIIDQLEELFAICPDPGLRHRFLGILLQLAATDNWVVIAAIRADFLEELTAFSSLATALKSPQALHLLEPMTPAGLERAITQPAARLNISFAPGLVERILDDGGNEPGKLTLLEFALTLLWQHPTIINGQLTHKAYNEIGGVQGALARYAENEVFARLSVTEQNQLRHVFVQLVQPGKHSRYTRRATSPEELGSERWQFVQKLAAADSRLVTIDQGNNGRQSVEIVHEALIQEWERYLQWLEEDYEFRLWQERLRSDLATWQDTNQEPEALLRGTQLTIAADWLSRRADNLAAAEHQFILRSQAYHQQQEAKEQARLREALENAQRAAASERRRQQVLRRAVVLVSLLAILAIGLALLANQNANQSRENEALARANASKAEAQSTRAAISESTAISGASALATEVIVRSQAEEAAITREAEANSAAKAEAVARATASASEAVAIDQANIALSRQLAAQAQTLQTEGDTELALLLAIEAGRAAETSEAFTQLRELITRPGRLDFNLEPSGQVDQAAWNANGSQILSWSDDATAIIWDVQSGQPAFTLTDTRTAIWNRDFSQVLITNQNNEAVIVDSQSGQIQQTFLHGYDFNQTIWSTSNQLLATFSWEEDIILWDAIKGEKVQEYVVDGRIEQGVWSSTDKFLAVVSMIEQTEFGPRRAVNVIDVGKHEIALSLAADEDANNAVREIMWHPDGEHLLIWYQNGNVEVWHLVTGQLQYALQTTQSLNQVMWQGHELLVTQTGDGSTDIRDAFTGEVRFSIYSDYGIKSMVWNAAATRLLTTSIEGVQIRDATTGDVQANLTHFAADHAVWNRDEQLILSYGGGDGIKIWDADSGRLQLTLKLDTPFRQAQAFEHVIWQEEDNRIYALGGAPTSNGDLIATWDIVSGKLLFFLSLNAYGHSMSISPDKNHLLTLGNGVAKVWQMQPTREGFNLYNDAFLTEVWWQPQGDYVLVNTGDYQSQVWNVREGSLHIELDQPGTVSAAVWQDDGRFLFTGHPQGYVNMWELATGELVKSFAHHPSGNAFGIHQLILNGDQTKLLTVASDGKVKLWDVDSGENLKIFSHPVGSVQAQWNRHETLLMTTSSAGEVIVWEATSGQKELVLFLETRIVSAAWNPDETLIMSVEEGGNVQIWDATNGEKLHTIRHDLGHALPAFWSPDGQYILVRGEDILVWDVVNEQIIETPQATINGFSTTFGWHSAWSPRDNLILALNEGKILVWDAQTGNYRFGWEHPDVTNVFWSPDGRFVVAVNHSGLIRVWDIVSGDYRFAMDHDNVFTIGWDGSGGYFVSVSGDSIKMWDLATGKEQFTLPILVFRTDDNQFQSVLWNGQQLMLRFDKSLIFYQTTLAGLIDLACQNTPRNLTSEEWERFVGDLATYRATCP